MKIETQKIFLLEKTLLWLLLAVSVVGFWYYEASVVLRILAIGLSLVGLFIAFSKTDQPKLGSQKELAVLLILYLGTFDLYNILYGMNLPLYIIMLAILLLVSIAFYTLLSLDRVDTLIEKPVFNVLVILMGLIVVEIFLSLYFWPVDPKVKSLIITIVFYLFSNLIYLHAHDMLRLKKVMGYTVVVFLILGILFLSTWLSLK